MNKNLLKVLISSLLKKGNKFKAEKLCVDLLKRLKNESVNDPLLVLNSAFYRIRPLVTLKNKKVAGTNLKIPSLIGAGQDISVAIKWLLEFSNMRSGNQKVDEKLVHEVLDILANKGLTLKKKNELHKMALANRPFLKFR